MGVAESIKTAARVKSIESLQDEARKFFEPQLTAIELGKVQIEQQSLEELEQSLERINECIKHPESFGILKLKVGPVGVIIVSTEAHYEVGILPILLERKRFILERIATLKGEQKIENLKEIIKESTDKKAQAELEKQISEMQTEIQKWQEKARDAEKAQINAQLEQQIQFARVETFERRSKVWLTFLQRESVATIVGAILLLIITVTLIIANFSGASTSDILNNAFLVILGYFFGQAVGRASASKDETK